jgi:DNA transposase THAP9
MRVYLATQLLSASVADAIELCDKDLKLEQFSESDGTCEYLRMFNIAFDLLDSKVNFSKGTKIPMRSDNRHVWGDYFQQISSFIRGLRHRNSAEAVPLVPVAKKTKKDDRVVAGPRKKGFIGFLVNIESYTEIFNLYVEKKGFLKYILGHKLSQDHLEMMFGTIRSSLGLNNNPTVIQECF